MERLLVQCCDAVVDWLVNRNLSQAAHNSSLAFVDSNGHIIRSHAKFYINLAKNILTSNRLIPQI